MVLVCTEMRGFWGKGRRVGSLAVNCSLVVAYFKGGTSV